VEWQRLWRSGGMVAATRARIELNRTSLTDFAL
jgi:hypothetical protein